MSTIENIVKSLAYATEHNQGLHLTHEEVPALLAHLDGVEAEGRGFGQVPRLVSAAETSEQLEHPLRSGQEMKKAIELYGGYEGSYYDDYQPMVEEFGSVILQESDNDYQGSTWVLYQDGERIGWLRFGWGSCSGCDALQGCDTIDEVQELMDFLWQSIRWFDTRDEALKFFVEHDWDGDWDANTEAARLFVEKAVKLLGPADAGDDVPCRNERRQR